MCWNSTHHHAFVVSSRNYSVADIGLLLRSKQWLIYQALMYLVDIRHWICGRLFYYLLNSQALCCSLLISPSVTVGSVYSNYLKSFCFTYSYYLLFICWIFVRLFVYKTNQVWSARDSVSRCLETLSLRPYFESLGFSFGLERLSLESQAVLGTKVHRLDRQTNEQT